MSRSRSLPFSGRWIVCAVVVVGLALVVVLTSGGRPASQQVDAARLAPAAMMKEAVRQERRVRDRSVSARAARRASRSRHAGLGDREAVALARRVFPQQMSAPLFSGRDLGDGTRVLASRGPGKALVTDKHGKKALLVSSAALEARDGRGGMAGVDLSLERSRAAIAPVNSSVPFTVDPVSAARVRFTDLGLGMRVAGAQDSPGARSVAARSSTAQITDDRAFFANVHPDTDAGVVPLPSGVELFLMARSQRAPQRFSLALDLPAGASLRRAVSKTPVPAGAPRSIEVVKDGRPLGYVSAPVAHDADGRSVAARMSIEGQKIVLDVAHRGLDLRYPISIDPEMVMPSNHDMGFAGWGWGESPVGGPWAGTIDNCAVYCGLAQWLPQYAQVSHNSSAAFVYQAPAKTAITRTTFGGVAHAPYMYAGMSFTYAYQGLLQYPTWERGRFANQDGLQPDTGYAIAPPNSTAFWGHENTVWTTQTPHEQNAAAFAMVAIHPYGYPVIGPTSSWAMTTMAWSQISISDTYPPKWHPETAAPTDSGWSDDNDAWHNRSFRATDEGLGLYTLKLTGAASIKDPPPAEGTVAGDTITAKCTGTPPHQAVCPTDWPTTQVGYKLNEGTNTLTAQATDATGNTIPGPARTWTEKIDRTPPSIDTPIGDLWDHRNQAGSGADHRSEGLYGKHYSVNLTARDGATSTANAERSGVKKINVQLLASDGSVAQSSPDPSPQSCASSCAKNRSFTLDTDSLTDGDYTVSVVAVDQLDHPSTPRTWMITIDRQGDVLKGTSWTGDPAVNASEVIATEAMTTDGQLARVEQLDSLTTLDRVPCSSDATGCLRQRSLSMDEPSQLIDPDLSITTGASHNDARLMGPSRLMTSHLEHGAPSHTGSLLTVTQPWQILPPGHGTTYEAFATTTDEVVGDEEMTVTYTLFRDGATGLPVRETRDFGDGTSEDAYTVYETDRRERATLSPDYFSAGGTSDPPGADYQSLPPPATPPIIEPPAPTNDEIVAESQGLREMLGLNAATSYIHGLLGSLDSSTRQASMALIGIPLSASELVEVKARFLLQGEAVDVLPQFASSRGATYGGSYIDQTTGKLYVGITSDESGAQAALRPQFTDSSRVETFHASRSLGGLTQLKDQILADWDAGNLDGLDVNAVGISQERNLVRIGTINPDATRAALTARYGNGIFVDGAGPAIPLDGTAQRATLNNQARSGVEITADGGDGYHTCTSGFGAMRRSAAARTTVYYTLTAGHCTKKGKHWLWQHVEADLTIFNFGRTSRNTHYRQSDPVDAQAIRLHDQRTHDSRTLVDYPNLKPHWRRVRGASDFSQEGDIVCYTGARSSRPAKRMICGRINGFEAHRNDATGSLDRKDFIRIGLDDVCRERFGDSGAAVWTKKRPSDKHVYAVGLLSSLASDGLGGCSGKKSQIWLATGIGPALAGLGLRLNTSDG